MAILAAGSLRHEVRFERPIPDDAIDGAGSGEWLPVATVRAQLRDVLPSRGEKLVDGLNIATRPTRVRIRYREGLSADMRIVIGRTLKDAAGEPYWQSDRVTQIVSGPAELGQREGLEFMVEDYSTAGNPA